MPPSIGGSSPLSNGLGTDISDEALLTVLVPGSRNTAGQVVLYDFEEGDGNVVNDVSGVGTPANLIIDNLGAVSWLPGALSVDGLLGPVRSLTDELIGFLPNLLAAAVVFVAGWFIARIVRRTLSSFVAASRPNAAASSPKSA